MLKNAITKIGTVINKGVLGLKKAIGINDALEVTPRIRNAMERKPRVLLASLSQIHGVNPQAIEARIKRIKEMMAAPGGLADAVQSALEHAFIPNVDPRYALVGLPNDLWKSMELGDPNIFMGEANPRQPNNGTTGQRKQSRQARNHKTPGHPLSGQRSKRITVVDPNKTYTTRKNTTSSSCMCSIWVLVALTTLSVALQEHRSENGIASVRDAASSILKNQDRT